MKQSLSIKEREGREEEEKDERISVSIKEQDVIQVRSKDDRYECEIWPTSSSISSTSSISSSSTALSSSSSSSSSSSKGNQISFMMQIRDGMSKKLFRQTFSHQDLIEGGFHPKQNLSQILDIIKNAIDGRNDDLGLKTSMNYISDIKNIRDGEYQNNCRLGVAIEHNLVLFQMAYQLWLSEVEQSEISILQEYIKELKMENQRLRDEFRTFQQKCSQEMSQWTTKMHEEHIKFEQDILKKVTMEIEKFYPSYIMYNLNMSSQYPGVPNTAEALRNTNLLQGAGTNNAENQWIQAEFGRVYQVTKIIIAPALREMSGGWGAAFLNGRSMEYLNIKDNTWKQFYQIPTLQEGESHTINNLSITTKSIRVLYTQNDYVGIGHWSFEGKVA